MECYKCGKDKPLSEFYKRKQKVKSVYCTHITQCKSCLSEAGKEYRRRNPDKVKEYAAKYRQRQESKVKSNTRAAKRRKADPLYKMSTYLRSRILDAFRRKEWKKGSRTEILLGADSRTVFDHIESLFSNGMNWRNHGKWHIDHKKPLSSAKDQAELVSLCHYTNLQPLWAIDNIKKGKKIL